MMKTSLLFVLYMLLAVAVILLAIVLGNMGAWYFAWLTGTAMIVMIAVLGGVLLDTQEEKRAARQLKESL